MKTVRSMLTVFISIFVLAGCGTGDGPTAIAGTPATPLPTVPQGFCDPINFETLCEQPTVLNFNGGVTTTIDNPDPSGINLSEKVGKMQKFSEEVFGGTKFDLLEAVDFSEGEFYKVKVWAQRAVPVSFKLEETGNPGGGVTLNVDHTGSGTWEELCYDFSGQTAGIPNPPVLALTIIFDLGVLGQAQAGVDDPNWTFYYDDIEQVSSCAGGGGVTPIDPDSALYRTDGDPDLVIPDDYAELTPFGSGSIIDAFYADDNTYSPALAVFSGTGYGANIGQIGYIGFPAGFAGAYETTNFKVKGTPNQAILVKLFDGVDALRLNLTSSAYSASLGDGWFQVSIPITNFAGADLATGIVFESDDSAAMQFTMLLTDIGFSGTGAGGPGATEPAVAAPTPPVRDAADVISIFSGAYTDVAGSNFFPDWGQSTVVSTESIAGDDTLKYASFNYEGTVLGSVQDASAMEFLHIDMWTADATVVQVSPIASSGAPAENLVSLTPISAGWNSYDIPVTDFTASGMTLADIKELKFDGQAGVTPSTIFLDNIYFYKTGGPAATEPTVAAPTPPVRDAADVISIFSGAYTDVAGSNFFPDWGQSTVVSTESIAGDDTLKYASFNYEGTVLGSVQDASAMEFLHVDMWTADATVVQVSPIASIGAPTENLVSLTPINAGWNSYDIPVSDFTANGMSVADIKELKFDGQAGVTPSTVFLDNIYFYKSAGGGGGDGTFVNGDFETGDFTGWTQTPNGGSITLDTSGQGGRAGTVARLIATGSAAGAQDVLLTQENLMEINTVAISGGDAVTVSVDVFGSLSGAGGVVFIELISRDSGGAETGRSFIGPAPITPTGTWTTYSSTVNVAADVSGGVTLQLKSSCGPVDGCVVDASFDNITITVSPGGGGSEPVAAAPTPPVRDAADVISIFSGAYTDVAGSNFFPDWGQSTVVTTEVIAGDDTLKYASFNYEGTVLGSVQDASAMEFLHIDMWTADATVVQVSPIASSGAPAESLVSLTPISAGWNSYDIPVTDFTASGMTLADIKELKFDGQAGVTPSTIFLDNIYFYKSAGPAATEPAVAAPTPPVRDAADVISIFSGAYTDVAGSNFFPDWGQSTVVSTESIAGDDTLKYASFNYEGTVLGSVQDASAMEFLHIDMWTADATVVQVSPIASSGAPAESLVSLTPISAGWNSYDIPVTDFTASGMTLADIKELKFDGQAGVTPSTIFLDNIYFYKTGGPAATEPTVAAPTPPVRDAADVISIFSGAYTDVAGSNFFPDWGQSTVVSTESIAGDDTLKYANFNYEGTVLGSVQDASAMEFLHIDMWTADATVVQVSPIASSGAPAESLVSLTPISAGWNSYDIPVTDFTASGMTLADIKEMKFDGQAGMTPSTVFLDNIYFYKTGGPAATEPTVAAPTPPVRDAADVISIFSGAYTDVAGSNFFPDWGQSTVVSTESIAGDDTLKYANFNYEGTVLGSVQDASAMEFLHIDMWTADATVVQVSPIASSGAPAESLVSLTPISAGWNSYDIPVTDFTASGMTLADIKELKFDGQAGVTPSTIFLDNIYFYKSAGPVGDGTFVNGDFETGDFTGWTQSAGGGSITLDTSGQGGRTGTVARLIATGSAAGAQDVLLSQIDLIEINSVSISGSDSVTVSVDVFGNLSGAGGVVFIELISRDSGGAETGRSFIGPAPITPTATWTTHSSTVNVAADVSGGITLQLKSSCGAVDGCGVDASFDNATIIIN